MENVIVISHPLVQHKLTIMRDKRTSCGNFRDLASEISMLLAYEVTRDLQTKPVEIETPVTKTKSPMLSGKKLLIISILRAGNGLLDGMLQLVPSARVGHIGLYRDPTTLEPVEYYFKIPDDTGDRDVIILDPMLATGNSAIAAISRIKERKPRSIKFVSLVSCPEGIKALHDEHPDVIIYTASIDERLNEHGYIVPGLGDAGDRLFGTK
jgi:uracil phosphoribosyltransferase